jgi:hypothetical protein
MPIKQKGTGKAPETPQTREEGEIVDGLVESEAMVVDEAGTIEGGEIDEEGGEQGIISVDPEKAKMLKTYQPTEEDYASMNTALLKGSYGHLNEAQKFLLFSKRAELLGVDLTLAPWVWTTIDKKLVALPTKHLGEQLRAVHGISVKPVEEWMNPDLGIYYLKLMGVTRDGRVDYEVGIVAIGIGVSMLQGGALADAIKVCWTQAKGRLAQSLGGLAPEENATMNHVMTSAGFRDFSEAMASAFAFKGQLGTEEVDEESTTPGGAHAVTIKQPKPSATPSTARIQTEAPNVANTVQGQEETSRTDDHEAQGNEYAREQARQAAKQAPKAPGAPAPARPVPGAPARATVPNAPRPTPAPMRPPTAAPVKSRT